MFGWYGVCHVNMGICIHHICTLCLTKIMLPYKKNANAKIDASQIEFETKTFKLMPFVILSLFLLQLRFLSVIRLVLFYNITYMWSAFILIIIIGALCVCESVWLIYVNRMLPIEMMLISLMYHSDR